MTVKSDSVTAAAKHLHISQPSLSSQLKVLEESLDTKLFKKVGRKNELTHEGSVIFTFCRQMFELSELMHESIVKKISHDLRRIYIGCSTELSNAFVSNVVSKFLSKFEANAKPRVTIVTGEHSKLIAQLKFRELDAVLTQVAVINTECENINQIAIPVKVISTKNEKIKTNSVIKYLSQIDAKWFFPKPGYKLRNEINSYLEDHPLKGAIALESDIPDVLLDTLNDKHSHTFMPVSFLSKQTRSRLQVLGPKDGYWKHRIWLVSHKVNKDDLLVKELSASLNEIVKEF